MGYDGENEVGDNSLVESVTSLMPVNASINRQLQTVTNGSKSTGGYYQEAIDSPHASFRLRILQERHMKPVRIPFYIPFFIIT